MGSRGSPTEALYVCFGGTSTLERSRMNPQKLNPAAGTLSQEGLQYQYSCCHRPKTGTLPAHTC